jgi:hypothetical protein
MKHFPRTTFLAISLASGLAGLVASGCREKQSAGSQTNTPAAAQPAAAGNVTAPAAPADASAGGAANTAASPAPTIVITGKNVTPLDQIPERVRRPLTLEEINQLPPEVRDMILRAQGRLPASPAPKASPATKK